MDTPAAGLRRAAQPCPSAGCCGEGAEVKQTRNEESSARASDV